MFISYKKLAQGAAALAFAGGIVVFAVSSSYQDVQPQPTQPKPVQKAQAKSKVAIAPKRDTDLPSRGAETKPVTDFEYTVVSGDTLYDLAIKYGVSVDEIMLASKLTSDKLSLNQKLLIPASGSYKKMAAMKRAADKKAVEADSAAKAQVKKTPSRSTRPAKTTKKLTVSSTRVGEMIPWSEVNGIFSRGTTATVIDVDTGLTFKVRRLQGTYHADSEPLTADDTAVLSRLYGGSWSWSRRAVVVIVDGKQIAASINGMPHGEDSISSNNFSGHICIHFLGSTTHGSSYTKSGKPTLDPQHQAMVRKAAGQ